MPTVAEKRGSYAVTRTQKSVWSFVTGVGSLILTVIIGFVSTPWILAWLGHERFGAWRVLLDCFAYLALFDLGLGGAVIGLLAPAVGSADSGLTRRVVAAALSIYVRITVVMLAAGAALALLLPRIIPNLGGEELRLAGWILLASVLWTPASVFKALAEARQQNYVVNLALLGQYLLIIAGALAAARLGWGLPGQAGAQTIGLLFPAVILVWIGWRHYPPSGFASTSISLKEALWKLNWPTLVSNISGRVSLLSDNIVIGWIAGPAAVAPFFLTQRLAALGQQQLQGIGNATWAALVELHARGDVTAFRSRLFELSNLVSGLGLAVLGPIAAYNRQFIAFWLGPTAYAGDAITALACLNGWFWSIFSLWGWTLSGTGNISAWAPYTAAFLVVNVAVSVAATFLFGLTGPLWGTLAGFLSIHLWAMPRVLERVFGIQPRHLFTAAARPLLFGGPYCALVWFVARQNVFSGWLRLGAEMAATVLVGVAIWWFTGITASQRAIWKTRLAILSGQESPVTR
jgi:O-antigen/teichoic acid export membrane protein